MTVKRQKNSFLTPLIVEVMPSGKKFKLFCQFTYIWQMRMKLSVPKGFETDFASIPKIFRIFIPKLGRYNKAAVIHDAIYQDVIAGYPFTRKEADMVFLGAMKDLGVKPWKRNLMYRAVRLFGWMAWRKR